MSDSLNALRSLMRALSLVAGGSPKTPLRVLAIAAIDAVHRRQRSRPIPRHRLRGMALCLDYQASTNALWDHKPFNYPGYDRIGERLEGRGLSASLAEYGARLQRLELQRPAIDGGTREIADARAYREAVARLSLATVTAIAFDTALDEAVRATEEDADLNTLFRMALQCQIIDDVLDYADDRTTGLPSFLTGAASVSLALESAAESVRGYGAVRPRTQPPLRLALAGLSLLASTLVRLNIWRRQSASAWLPKYS